MKSLVTVVAVVHLAVNAYDGMCERRSKREPVDGGVTGYRSQAYPEVKASNACESWKLQLS